MKNIFKSISLRHVMWFLIGVGCFMGASYLMGWKLFTGLSLAYFGYQLIDMTAEEIVHEENKIEFIEKHLQKGDWINIKDEWPKPNSEVIVFYIDSSDEGTSCSRAELMHEKFIEEIESPIKYWIYQPE